MSILTIKNLSKHFDGVKAVDGLSLEFKAGQITGLIGPNGSGKSTLINLLTGIAEHDSGEIISSHGLTRTFQDVRLFEQMSVLDNILVVLTERSVWSALFEQHTAEHLAEAKEVLEQVGLWSKQDELAANLSYGQRKLLEIARVLAMTRGNQVTEIIFLDEPFAGLFPEMIKVVVGVIKELKAKGKTIVLVEHNMELIRQLSDHLVVLDAGKLLAEGEPSEVLAKPAVIEAYLGE